MAALRHSTGLAADVDVVMYLKLLWNFVFNACNALNYMGFAYNASTNIVSMEYSSAIFCGIGEIAQFVNSTTNGQLRLLT